MDGDNCAGIKIKYQFYYNEEESIFPLWILPTTPQIRTEMERIFFSLMKMGQRNSQDIPTWFPDEMIILFAFQMSCMGQQERKEYKQLPHLPPYPASDSQIALWKHSSDCQPLDLPIPKRKKKIS